MAQSASNLSFFCFKLLNSRIVGVVTVPGHFCSIKKLGSLLGLEMIQWLVDLFSRGGPRFDSQHLHGNL